jgi:dephospho-CoA kinase
MILGVTGSMGSGKSTASLELEQLGFRRLDSDQIVREQLLLEAEVIQAITGRFGAQAVDQMGRIDRRELARVVFDKDAEREWLEALLHPRLFNRWREAFQADPAGPWVVEVPLLFEKGLENWFDFIVCVASSLDLQLARLEKRGIPHALAEQRISKQLPLALKLELADFVLWNDGSRDFLREQLVHLQQRLLNPTARA